MLSDSTESYDRGVKAGHYRRIPSIREYVLCLAALSLIEVWRKNEQERWEVAAVAGEGESADLASLDIVIDVDAVSATAADLNVVTRLKNRTRAPRAASQLCAAGMPP